MKKSKRVVIVCSLAAAVCFGIVSYGYFYRGRLALGWVFALLTLVQLILASKNYFMLKKAEFGGGYNINNQEKKKKELWRIVVGIISIAFIVYMWVENDIITIYTTMPKEQVVPLIATTILVSLIKVGVISGAILLIKWIVEKIAKKSN